MQRRMNTDTGRLSKSDTKIRKSLIADLKRRAYGTHINSIEQLRAACRGSPWNPS
jgi:hypothetical protein